MRQGGRLPERLTARDLAGRMKLMFAVHRDSLSLVVMFCNCQIVSKLPARHLCVVNHVCTSYTSGRGKIVPHNVTFDYLKNGLQRSCLHHRDRYHAVTQAYNFGGETHLGTGDTSAFVSPSAIIARALSSTIVASTALMKGPQRF